MITVDIISLTGSNIDLVASWFTAEYRFITYFCNVQFSVAYTTNFRYNAVQWTQPLYM